MAEAVHKNAPQCFYYPKCNRNPCNFWHPKSACRDYPQCHKKAFKCHFDHPFCVPSGNCKCGENQDPQYNHRTKKADESQANSAGDRVAASGVKELLTDPMAAKFLFKFASKFDWWPEFQRKYRVIYSGHGTFGILPVGDPKFFRDAQQLANDHLARLICHQTTIADATSEVFTDAQIQHIESTTTTLITAVSAVWFGATTLEVVCGDITEQSVDVVLCSINWNRQPWGIEIVHSQVSTAIGNEYNKHLVTNGNIPLDDKIRACLIQLSPRNHPFVLVRVAEMSFQRICYNLGLGSAWRSNVLNVLKYCDAQGHTSIAIPAMATGNLGGSISTVINELLLILATFSATGPQNLTKVVLVVFQEQLMSEALQHLRSNVESNPQGCLSTRFQFYGEDQNIRDAARQVKQLHDNHMNRSQKFKQHFQLKDTEAAELNALASSLNLLLTFEGNTYTVQGSQQQLNDFSSASSQFWLDKSQDRHLLPPYWSSDVNVKGHCRILLPTLTFEYLRVIHLIRRTNTNVQIASIERVENPTRYRQYVIQKESVAIKLRGTGIEVQKCLFHGTLENNIDAICQEGFNRSLAGANATAYGKGSYFSTDFNYSLAYCKGGKKLFYCNVITGRYQISNSSHLKALDLVPGSQEKYDSAVNQSPNPNIFVTFHDSSAYPAYLITIA